VIPCTRPYRKISKYWHGFYNFRFGHHKPVGFCHRQSNLASNIFSQHAALDLCHVLGLPVAIRTEFLIANAEVIHFLVTLWGFQAASTAVCFVQKLYFIKLLLVSIFAHCIFMGKIVCTIKSNPFVISVIWTLAEKYLSANACTSTSQFTVVNCQWYTVYSSSICSSCSVH